MKAKKLIAVMAASAIALSFAGCQSADTPEGSETEADAGESGIESTVTLNDTYWAGSNIRVRMLSTRRETAGTDMWATTP